MPKNYGASKPTLASFIPENRKDRIKLFSAVGVLLVCGIWLAIYVVSNMGPGPAKPLSTPGWKVAQELNTKLVQRTEFNDISFAVESENPLRFKVHGMVHTAKEMDSLKAYLNEIRPESDYDIDVVIPGPQ